MPSSLSKTSSPKSELLLQAKLYAYGWERTKRSYAFESVRPASLFHCIHAKVQAQSISSPQTMLPFA